MATESDLVSSMKGKLEKEFGGVWIKLHGGRFQERGLPDLIGLVGGLFFGFEVKLPGKEDSLSPAQSYQLQRFLNNGGVACMVTSTEQAVKIVRQVLSKR